MLSLTFVCRYTNVALFLGWLINIKHIVIWCDRYYYFTYFTNKEYHNFTDEETEVLGISQGHLTK